MRTLEQLPNVINKVLSATAGITALVGSKIRPIKAGQEDTLPYIIFRKTNGDLETSKDGNSNLAQAIVEVEIYSDSYDNMNTLAALVRQTLDGYVGTIDSHEIKLMKYLTTRDNYQDAAALDGIYMLQQDYLIFAKVN